MKSICRAFLVAALALACLRPASSRGGAVLAGPIPVHRARAVAHVVNGFVIDVTIIDTGDTLQ